MIFLFPIITSRDVTLPPRISFDQLNELLYHRCSSRLYDASYRLYNKKGKAAVAVTAAAAHASTAAAAGRCLSRRSIDSRGLPRVEEEKGQHIERLQKENEVRPHLNPATNWQQQQQQQQHNQLGPQRHLQQHPCQQRESDSRSSRIRNTLMTSCARFLKPRTDHDINHTDHTDHLDHHRDHLR